MFTGVSWAAASITDGSDPAQWRSYPPSPSPSPSLSTDYCRLPAPTVRLICSNSSHGSSPRLLKGAVALEQELAGEALEAGPVLAPRGASRPRGPFGGAKKALEESAGVPQRFQRVPESSNGGSSGRLS